MSRTEAIYFVEQNDMDVQECIDYYDSGVTFCRAVAKVDSLEFQKIGQYCKKPSNFINNIIFPLLTEKI
jgi:hypothetical protein